MQSGRWIAIIGLIVPLTLPTVSTAQGGSGAQLFTSYDNAFPNGAVLAGFGLRLGTETFALRGSFGVGLSRFSGLTPTSSQPPGASRWTGDVDVVLAENVFGLTLFGGALHPYGFAGVGAHSATTSPTLVDAVKTWSYGGGLTVPFGSTVSLQGEVRNRSSFGSTVVSPADFVRGSEYRLGIDLRLGGSSRSAAPSSRVGSRGGASPSGTIWPTGSAASGAARRVVPRGEQFLGVPYVYGGSTPKGFDCSGFVQYIYRREGIELPRTSRQMAGSGLAVDRLSIAIGDLLLFADGGQVSHVAIYAGSGRIIHSSSSGNGVRYDDLSSQRGKWFADHLVKVRRVAIGSGAAIALAKSLVPFDHFDPPDLAPIVKR